MIVAVVAMIASVTSMVAITYAGVCQATSERLDAAADRFGAYEAAEKAAAATLLAWSFFAVEVVALIGILSNAAFA